MVQQVALAHNWVRLQKNIELAGYQLANVKTVLLTHLHPDHVCGIAQNGKAVFPNATVYAHEREADYWLNPASEKNSASR